MSDVVRLHPEAKQVKSSGWVEIEVWLADEEGNKYDSTTVMKLFLQNRVTGVNVKLRPNAVGQVQWPPFAVITDVEEDLIVLQPVFTYNDYEIYKIAKEKFHILYTLD